MIEPMLAKKYDEAKMKKFIGDPYIQPKLDGIRATTFSPAEGRVLMRSRQANDLGCYVPHLVKQAKVGGLHEDVTLDGELYLHGHPFQDLMHIIKGKSELTKKIQYHVYDIYLHESPTYKFFVRDEILRDVLGQYKDLCPSIIKVQTVPLNGIPIRNIHDTFKKQGYEGIMIRDGGAPYHPGKRSSGLLKYKDYEEDDFLIIDVFPGKGKNEECATLLCNAKKKGNTFTCTSPGDYEEKKIILKNSFEVIGKKVTVKYLSLTRDGIPREPVALKIRELE